MPPFPLVPGGPLGAAYVPILLSEVEQEQRPSGNGDREAIVVGAGLCDGEDERAYTVYDPILGEEKYLIYFKRFAGAKTGFGTICRKKIFSANCPFEFVEFCGDNLPNIYRFQITMFLAVGYAPISSSARRPPWGRLCSHLAKRGRTGAKT